MSTKNLKAIAAVCLILSSAGGWAAGKGGSSSDAGNAGGVIIRNGEVLSFDEAQVEISEQRMNEVPGLAELVATVQKMPLGDTGKTNLLSATVNAGHRKYFRIREITDQQKKDLLSNYHRVVKVPENVKLEVAAFTLGKETFLLPEFFSLSQEAKEGILFHEALWALGDKLTYKRVVDAELAFKRWKRAGADDYEEDLFNALEEAMNDPYLNLTAAISFDIRQGRLQLPLKLFSLFEKVPQKSNGEYLKTELVPFLVKKMIERPDMAAYRVLYRNADSIRIQSGSAWFEDDLSQSRVPRCEKDFSLKRFEPRAAQMDGERYLILCWYGSVPKSKFEANYDFSVLFLQFRNRK